MIITYHLFNMIPEHCINIFKERFGVYPSVTNMEPPFDDKMLDRILSNKYHTIWYERFIDSEGIKHDKNLLKEFDTTGILLYTNENGNIFILSMSNKQDIVDYTIQQLKK